MITDVQQYRIHMGDEEAFGQVYRANNLRVYHRALAALGDKLAAKAVVIEAFTAFRASLRDAEGPCDADLLLYTLTEAAIDKVDALRRQPCEEAPAPPDETQAPPGPVELAEEVEGEPDSPILEPAHELHHSGKAYKQRKRINTLCSIGLAAIALLAVWLLLAELMRLGVLPARDLGYSWFNEHVFRLFFLRL